MSGQLDDHELVDLIETFPILYDKDSARGMKNAVRKDAAWRAISSKLGASERACLTRWKSIRDRFGKEFRRFQDNPNEPTYWDMFPRLLFLKDHYKHGLVRHESLDNMKFEPKERRRRTRSRYGDTDKRIEDEDEMDAELIEFNQNLIELVKLRPVLYDRHKIRDSKNLSAKNEAWRAISGSLDASEVLCYNRWKKLRDRFAREYRNHQINKTAPVTWIYFNDLLFLSRHYRKGVPLVIKNMKKRGRPPKTARDTMEGSPAPMSQTETGEQVWGTDYPYDSENDELENEQYDDPENLEDDVEVVSDAEQETKYLEMDFIQMDATQQELQQQEQLEGQQPLPPQQLIEGTQSLDTQQQQLISTLPAISDALLDAENIIIDNSEDGSAATLNNVTDVATEAVNSPELLIGNVISNMETVLRQSKNCLQALHMQNQRHQQELHLNRSVTELSAGHSVLTKAQILLDGLSAEQRRNAERKIIHFLCDCQIKTLDGEEIEDVVPCQMYN